MLPDLSGLGSHDVAPVGAPHDAPNVELRRSSDARLHVVAQFLEQVAPDAVMKSRDQTERTEYNALEAVAVFDVVYDVNHPTLLSYAARRSSMRVDDDGCNAYGTSSECVRTDKALAGLAAEEPLGPLADGVNEKYLVHGTGVDAAMSIVHTNFQMQNASRSGYYGTGFYLAEDAGKADVYSKSDGYESVNQTLGIDTSEQPLPKTYYMLIARTLLGCANHAAPQYGQRSDTIDLLGLPAYAHEGPGGEASGLRPPYDSLIIEHKTTPRGTEGQKWREFLVRESNAILPVMLVAYVRKRDPLRRYNPKLLACDEAEAVKALMAIMHSPSATLFARGNALENLSHYPSVDAATLVAMLQHLVQALSIPPEFLSGYQSPADAIRLASALATALTSSGEDKAGGFRRLRPFAQTNPALWSFAVEAMLRSVQEDDQTTAASVAIQIRFYATNDEALETHVVKCYVGLVKQEAVPTWRKEVVMREIGHYRAQRLQREAVVDM
tara:strand:- start:2536 stop:4026 length:1491 start_codon:yes stop_codon:yes gene_type:complete